jgi:adenine-specific DNA-methyltransferase
MDEREHLRYPIEAPDGSKIRPKRQWLWEADRFKEAKKAGEIEILKTKEGWSVQYKQYLNDDAGIQRSEKQQSVLSSASTFIDGVYTQTGTAELREILGDDERVPYPKPSSLIEILLETRFVPSNNREAIVLDSFAGSGTTAHAVLAANQKDGGDRKFILIETEAYADDLTAERVRRVIKGVKTSKKSELKNGLGGSFTYCDLGESLDLDRFFDGKGAPTYEQVARYVVYTAVGQSAPNVPNEPRKDWFVSDAGGYRIHLIYRPDLAFMRGNNAALSLPLANEIAKSAKGRPVLVYAAAKFISQAELTRLGITFCQLPYSVHRVLGEAPDAS